MKLIKNAICYRIALPSVAQLEYTHLDELRYSDIQEAEREKYGFVPVPIPGVTSDIILTEPFEGGVAFALRMDEKIIPAAVINAETKRRGAEWLADTSLKRVPKDIRESLRDAVIGDLVRRALVKTTVVTGFYHRESRFLFVAGTKRQADIFTGMLVRAVGAAKTETINVSDVKGRLTTRMRAHVTDGTGFDDSFSLESGVWLERGKDKVTVQMEQLDAARQAITEALDGGFQVSAVRLTHADSGVSFKLTKDFHLKAIDGLDVEGEQEFDEPVEQWAQEAGVQTGMMVRVLEDLCVMFDYKEPDGETAEGDEVAA